MKPMIIMVSSFFFYFKGILKYDWRNKNKGLTPESTVLTIVAYYLSEMWQWWVVSDHTWDLCSCECIYINPNVTAFNAE